MLNKSNKTYSITNLSVRVALFLQIVFCVFVISGNAQNTETKKASIKVSLPIWQSYKGVVIGMTADEVVAKIGAPKSRDDADLFYVFSDNETVQILLDGQKKVRNISAMFSAEYQNPPKLEDVFGKGVQAALKSDGSVYKMVRYTDAGYFVSYSRTGGDAALIIVMIQKF
jgi:hypothetical protein